MSNEHDGPNRSKGENRRIGEGGGTRGGLECSIVKTVRSNTSRLFAPRRVGERVASPPPNGAAVARVDGGGGQHGNSRIGRRPQSPDRVDKRQAGYLTFHAGQTNFNARRQRQLRQASTKLLQVSRRRHRTSSRSPEAEERDADPGRAGELTEEGTGQMEQAFLPIEEDDWPKHS